MHKYFSSSHRAGRVAASAAITLLVAAGGTLATVSPAAAATVGTSGCTSYRYDWNSYIASNAVNFRSGPGTSYSSMGLLSKGTKHIMRCFSSAQPAGWSWCYIKVTSGPHAGEWGWVRADFSHIVA